MMTDIGTKRTYVGAGIILMRPRFSDEGNDTYLLLKGRATGHNDGVWSFSKGHPEPRDCETPLRTAVRETFEETGFLPGKDYDIVGNSIRFGKRPYWIGIMRTSLVPTLSIREHTTAGWFTWDEITLLTTNTDVRCWVKKSPQGEFQRIISLVVSRMRDTRSIA